MADLGSLGFVRAARIRRITDFRHTRNDPLTWTPRRPIRRLVYFWVVPPTPTPLRVKAGPMIRPGEAPPQPETYWTRPVVMDGKRGRLYWQLGNSGPYKTAGIPQSARDPDGWRWYGPGIQQLKFAVSAGTNSLTLTLKHSTNTQPRPTARILANGALGIEAISIEFPSGVGIFHARTFYFTATTAGVVILQLEWLLFEEDATCVWQGLSVSD